MYVAQSSKKGGVRETEPPLLLLPNMQVRVAPAPGKKNWKQQKRKDWAVVTGVRVRASHFEVEFDGVSSENQEHYVCAHTMQCNYSSDVLQHVIQPSFVIQDIDEKLKKVEVEIGASVYGSGKLGHGSDKFKQEAILWSKPSEVCTVGSKDGSLLAPLGPVGIPDGHRKSIEVGESTRVV